ncbi:hypothetical protein E1295_10840 [Nonomuraea mesophila]|uniref:Uncharacterized protein n=1 Tax=Nonomuraea mesophila TaxID=2530382 RepID=A0A4R5FTV8_9ACTN|nr:hypothetical protein [Nonomuraea mesophila]TDE56434.1 hypothetical protein E1295_10840 [Nonomuraea mesophila]
MRTVLAALSAVVVLLVAGGVPASATGAWAVTYLDPPPSRFDGGTPYALGFWVLQHGTHPFEGDLEPVGLRFTRDDGTSMRFDGTALPEAGHYATSVVLPDGVWKVEGVQGLFPPYEVGTLTVPGALDIRPVPPHLVLGTPPADAWGAVHPPGLPAGGTPEKTTPAKSGDGGSDAATPGGSDAAKSGDGGSDAAAAGTPAGGPTGKAAAVREPASGQDGGGVPAYTLLIAAAVGALGAVVVARVAGPWRRRNPASPPPGGTSADTVTFP